MKKSDWLQLFRNCIRQNDCGNIENKSYIIISATVLFYEYSKTVSFDNSIVMVLTVSKINTGCNKCNIRRIMKMNSLRTN